MTGLPQAALDRWFTHHPPRNDMEIERYRRIRAAGKTFAEVIVAETPGGADQDTAIQRVREAVMISNAAIACYGDPLTPPS
jgi:hypothetical protein